VAAALVAKHVGDRTAEIECRKNAVAAAGKLLRAVTLAYEAGVLSPIDMFKLSWHHCEARIALINLTIPASEEAKNARIQALQELLKLADMALETERIRYQAGLAPYAELESILVDQSRIAARLADERGNHDEELEAVRRIMDVYANRVRRCHQLHAVNQSCQSELDAAERQFKDIQVVVQEVELGHKIRDAGDENSHNVQISLAELSRLKSMADHRLADTHLSRLKLIHRAGGCDAFTVIEAAVRERLASTLLRQCELDIMELHKR
jgi:hypothetical protein